MKEDGNGFSRVYRRFIFNTLSCEDMHGIRFVRPGWLNALPTLLFAGGIGAFAQDRLTLHEAVDLALKHNALVAVGEQRIKVAEAQKLQAGLSPNPRLFFQHENVRAWQRPLPVYFRDTDSFLYASQVIERSGKKQLRVDVAGAGIAYVGAEQELIRRQLQLRVAAAYWSAVGANRIHRHLAEEEQNLLQTVKYTGARVTEGAAVGTDLMRIRLEHQKTSAQLAVAGQDVARAKARLFQEIGLTAPTSVELSTKLESTEAVAVPELAQVLEQRPEIQSVKRALLQAEANAKLQRANIRQDPEVLAGYKRTGGFDALLVGVQINLPVRNKNQGLIQAADAEIRSAQENLRGATVMVEAELAAARTDYQLKKELVEQIMPAMVENARNSSKLVTQAWKEGSLDILRMLDAERARIDAELQYTKAMIEFQQSVLQLRAAAGVNP